MDRIMFHSVVPAVFAQCGNLDSDVWEQDVTFHRGQLCLVEADSGKGKSTFCSYISGYRKDYAGSIFFDDKDTRKLRMADWIGLRQSHVSLLFQELRLFPELTAYENIEIKNRLTRHKTKEEIVNWFEMLGIADKIQSKVGRMSFGQQQRVAMIRALAQPFDFLIADEPISHLDDNNAKIMGEIMIDEAKKQGAGVIVTSIGKHMDIGYERVLRL